MFAGAPAGLVSRAVAMEGMNASHIATPEAFCEFRGRPFIASPDARNEYGGGEKPGVKGIGRGTSLEKHAADTRHTVRAFGRCEGEK